MSIKQKDITVIAFDFRTHEMTRYALEKTLEVIEPKEVIVVSDKDIMPSTTWVPCKPTKGFDEYSWMMMKWMWPLVDTSHAMYIQYDGMPWDANQWDDNFLNYDYIGAVWPWEPEGKNVGNGGFCLRSKKFLDACGRDPVITMDPARGKAEDAVICIDKRPYLEQTHGIKFAPSSVAHKFSFEMAKTGDTFGWHGVWNIFAMMSLEDIDFYMQHLGFKGWNIYLWHHVLVTMCGRGLQDHLITAIGHLKAENPPFMPDLLNWLMSEDYPNRNWLIIQLQQKS
jgi:hypothetical protein